MNTYRVSIPIAGSASFEVEAASAREAKKKVWEVLEEGVEPEVEWEYFETICDGNVLHPLMNEVEVQRIREPMPPIKGKPRASTPRSATSTEESR